MTPLSDRDLLQRLLGGPVSGDVLAREGGLTRAAVWKRIEALREAGVGIDAQAGRGYALSQPLDLLDGDVIRSALPAVVRNDISSLEVAWSLDSTNARLLAIPAAASLQVLLAERQTGGRGRRGRTWTSPLAANLYLSVARRFDGGLARLGGLSLVAGIAIADALHDLGLSRAKLKWPNDVVLRDGEDVLRKLGGILVEGGGEHGGPVRAVIGIGLNVRMPERAARAIDQPWTDLATELGDALPSRNTLAAALLGRLLPALQQFDRTGLATFLPAYSRHDALAGKRVTVHAHDGEQTGTALGLADDGALRVRFDAGGERSVHAGEISVRQAVRHG